MTGRALSLLALVALVAVLASAQQPFRGVNIGGWLVLESWITPDLYAAHGVPSGAGEWQFCAAVGGGSKCAAALAEHWDTWVSRAELATLAAAGVNWLRVPVGYWIVDIAPGEPWAPGGLPYLQRLLDWAAALNMSVLVDLHGAPGSQNGHDNSGRTGPIDWATPANINRTVVDLGLIYQALRAYPAFQALELLNEPWTTYIGGPITIATLQQFYLTAHDHLRGLGFDGAIVMSDGWTDAVWNGFMAPPRYQNIFIDTHIYRCFGSSSPHLYDNVVQTCTSVAARLHALTQRDWTIVGEYSLCLDDASITNDTLAW